MFGPNDEAATRSFIQTRITNAQANPITNYSFAVTIKESGAMIGSGELHMRETFHGAGEAEVGWILHQSHWGTGLGTELGQRLLEFGFESLGLHRIIARCNADNLASARIMEKIGMRKEAHLQDARPPHKKSTRPFSDELRYAMLKDDWNIQKEIAHYNTLPCEFNGFAETPTLTDGEIYLVCTEKKPANPEKKHVPSYSFAICRSGEKVGTLNLRIGYGGGHHNSSLYYGGHIGYEIQEPYRGKSYATRACKLLAPIARHHKMQTLLITNNTENHASRRVCEKLGAKLLRMVRIPEHDDLYKTGQRFENIFEWAVENSAALPHLLS